MGSYWVGFWHGVAVAFGTWLVATMAVALAFARRLIARDGIEP